MSTNLHPHFKLVGIEPGVIISVRLGAEIDFRKPVDYEVLKKLWETGCPYIQLTTEGKKALIPSKSKK